MISLGRPVSVACAIVLTAGGALFGEPPRRWSVQPSQLVLDSPESSYQLLADEIRADGRRIDVTRSCHYKSADPRVASVSESGRVTPRGEGKTVIRVTRDAVAGDATVSVTVRGVRSPTPVSFPQQIVPILSKAGCNSGGCHGKAEGQNGFKLSVFGFDARADFAALTKEGRGRRVMPSAPDRSLLLRKSSATLPHGGGGKVEVGGLWHQRMRRWIKEGAAWHEDESSTIQAIEVEPSQSIMTLNGSQQLRVLATDGKGRRRCVTAEAEFQSNAEPIATVDREGVVRVSETPGEAAILVRYMGHVAVARFTLPQRVKAGAPIVRPPEHNFIDKHVWNKLERLGVAPSELADDATFLRRAYLDVIGTLPTVDETRRFLADPRADKRDRLVAALLERDEYADFWAMRWGDLLRVDRNIVTPQGAVAMTRWLRKQFRDNTPYDRFAWAIVTARGGTLTESPTAFYQVHKDAPSAGRAISQIFLGVRIECAQCHHHPYEKWSQQDYFAFASFFTGVSRKGDPLGGQKIVANPGSAFLKHPRTGELTPPRGLGAEPANLEGLADRRSALADWMVDPKNPFFARVIANRLWSHYFGRGLVEPVDDMRATNPATNEPLLDALAQHLIEVRYDLRALTRTILASRVYQLSSRTQPSNRLDQQNHSHAAWRPMPAEVLLDAICQTTGAPQRFNGWPEGVRAIQVWDNRMPSYFFRIFGRPQRVSVCECERGNEPSIAQALHLMNSEESVRKIRHRKGRAAKLAASERTPEQIIEELYLAVLSRFPTSQETALMRQAFDEPSSDRRAATEDVMWTLLNTREFVFNH